MKKWNLTRNSTGDLVNVFYQNTMPTLEYVRAFGRAEEFTLTEVPITQDEIDEEREQRRARHYPDFRDLLLAVYFKEKGNNQPMNRLVALIDFIRQQNG